MTTLDDNCSSTAHSNTSCLDDLSSTAYSHTSCPVDNLSSTAYSYTSCPADDFSSTASATPAVQQMTSAPQHAATPAVQQMSSAVHPQAGNLNKKFKSEFRKAMQLTYSIIKCDRKTRPSRIMSSCQAPAPRILRNSTERESWMDLSGLITKPKLSK